MLDVASMLTRDVTRKRSEPPRKVALFVSSTASDMRMMEGVHGIVVFVARSVAQPDAKFTVPPLSVIDVPMYSN